MNDESKCCREKYFSEKNDTEKIEELKRELVRTQRQVKDISHCLRLLSTHSHKGDVVVTPILTSNHDGEVFRVHNFE